MLIPTLTQSTLNQTYLDNDVTSKTVNGNIWVRLVAIDNTQRASQVVAELIQITLCLLDLGELLRTTGLGVGIDRQLVGGGTANEIREIVELQRRARVLGGFDWGRVCRRGLFFQGLRLTTELGEESAALAGRERGLEGRG